MPLPLTIRIFTQLTPAQEAQVEDFKAHATELNPRQRSQEQQAVADDKFCSRPDLKEYIFGFRGDQLVGRVHVFKRTIDFDRQPKELGGFGAVKTRDEFRRQGVATQLLARARQELEKQNCDWAFLCTNVKNPFLVKLYQQFGFELLNKPYTFLGRSGTRYQEEDGMVAPIKSSISPILASREPFDIGQGNW